jgi:hypothetical protein
MEKLAQLSEKFRNAQTKGRTIDKGVQAGGGGLKHAQTQCTAAPKVEMGCQVEPPKKQAREVQTVSASGGPCDVKVLVCKVEIIGERKKKKKKKKVQNDKGIANQNGADEESYYEYYEEEVEVEVEDEEPYQTASKK